MEEFHQNFRFAPLGDIEDPLLGLFYLEHPSALDKKSKLNPASDLPTAAGMASLVNESGMLATASHVPLRCGAKPGETIEIYGACDALPVRVAAKVLMQGWMGPRTTSGYALPMSKLWDGVVDERPAVFGQDLCFLQILPGTARWHPRGGLRPRGTPTNQLLQSARVLPLGYVTDRSVGDELRAWSVVWEFGAPSCTSGSGKVVGIEPNSYDALRFRSDEVGHGFSGSPIWHVSRRVVVGVHRRGVLSFPGNLIACDTRAVVRALPGLAVRPDRRLLPLLEQYQEVVSEFSGQRHPEFLNWYNPASLVDQHLSVATANPTGGSALAESPKLPALEYLSSRLSEGDQRYTLLLGAPGTGKSTLLRRTAAELASRTCSGTQVPIVPIILSAREFENFNFALRPLINAQLSGAIPATPESVDLLECAAESGARLVLLIDGLDEVSRESSIRILNLFAPQSSAGNNFGGSQLGMLHHVIVASRHTDDMRRSLGPERGGMQRLHLHALDPAQTRELAHKLLGQMSSEQESVLNSGLQDLRLLTNGATPLQVWMAALIFRHNGRLPSRPLDLIHEFVSIVIDGVLGRLEATPGKRLSRSVRKSYLPHLRDILESIGSLWSAERSSAITERLLQEHFERLAQSPTSSEWLGDAEGLCAFIFELLPAAIGVIDVRGGESGAAQLEWVHATFGEYFSACHALRTGRLESDSREQLVLDTLKRGDHWPALVILSEMERRGESEAVADILATCMKAMSSTSNLRLFALRALAVGLDGGGKARSRQVQLLVRLYVSEYAENTTCARLFYNADLPDPDEIVARPELREDILLALKERFSVRLKLLRPGGAPKVLDKEAKLIGTAKLWSEMRAIGVHEPQDPYSRGNAGLGEGAASIEAAEAQLVGGISRIVFQDEIGRGVQMDVPSHHFAEQLIRATRLSSPSMGTASIVAIASTWLIDLARAQIAGDSLAQSTGEPNQSPHRIRQRRRV